MSKIKQHKLFNDFLGKLSDSELQYYWSDKIAPFIKNNKLNEQLAFLWWKEHQKRRWPETYKIS